MRERLNLRNDEPTDSTDGDVSSWSDESVSRTDGRQVNERPSVLVSMSDYWPEEPLRIVGQLPAPITVRLLRLPNGETASVLPRPDQYTGYVARIEIGETLTDSPTVLFTRETLEEGHHYEFHSAVQVFSERLRLLRTALRASERQAGNESPVPA